ncbi:MAG TPA: hypothetical protein VGS18_04125, partial [Thermoplasmata archaeon]|nr:hypothetical protein [Thermoplasmata archaeon]
QSWNYPALILAGPWGVLTLPFFATVAMAIVSIGVGLGMSVSLLLAVRLLRSRRRELGGPTAFGSMTGLTPAMIALLTLGACCSTTAAATASLGVIAQSSGTNVNLLLANSWFVGVFQIAVLYVALLAQEQLIAVYGVLFGVGAPNDGAGNKLPVAGGRLRSLSVAGLRLALLVGGLTWILSVFADWLSHSPSSASGSAWSGWIVQHGLVGGIAIVASLFPRGTLGVLADRPNSLPGRFLRAALAAVGASLAIGVPPPIASSGFHGLGNELISAGLGAGALGAVPFPSTSLGALAFRWGVQMLLLGGFVAVAAIAPVRVAEAFAMPSPLPSARAPDREALDPRDACGPAGIERGSGPMGRASGEGAFAPTAPAPER